MHSTAIDGEQRNGPRLFIRKLPSSVQFKAARNTDPTQSEPAPLAASSDTNSGDADTSRILRLKEVVTMTGMKRSSIYAAMKRGDFPLQVNLTKRSVGWRESAIHAWLRSRKPTH